MIDPGKLLGGLLGGSGALGDLGSLGQTAKNALPGGALGLGLLGVAMAAFEHFTEQKSAASSAGSMPVPGAPLPPPISGGVGATPPPMPPMAGSGMTPPPVPGMPSAPGAPLAPSMAPSAFPAPPAAPQTATQADPVLLIRAMIAAANADGVLDETERMRILGQLEGVGLTEEEKDFLCAEFDAPRSLQAIAAEVSSPAMAAQVFTVSLLAVDVDTQAERDYLGGLRLALNLDEGAAQSIARRLGKQI